LLPAARRILLPISAEIGTSRGSTQERVRADPAPPTHSVMVILISRVGERIETPSGKKDEPRCARGSLSGL